MPHAQGTYPCPEEGTIQRRLELGGKEQRRRSAGRAAPHRSLPPGLGRRCCRIQDKVFLVRAGELDHGVVGSPEALGIERSPSRSSQVP